MVQHPNQAQAFTASVLSLRGPSPAPCPLHCPATTAGLYHMEQREDPADLCQLLNRLQLCGLHNTGTGSISTTLPSALFHHLNSEQTFEQR